jgi:hypothetical protein
MALSKVGASGFVKIILAASSAPVFFPKTLPGPATSGYACDYGKSGP